MGSRVSLNGTLSSCFVVVLFFMYRSNDLVITDFSCFFLWSYLFGLLMRIGFFSLVGSWAFYVSGAAGRCSFPCVGRGEGGCGGKSESGGVWVVAEVGVVVPRIRSSLRVLMVLHLVFTFFLGFRCFSAPDPPTLTLGVFSLHVVRFF